MTANFSSQSFKNMCFFLLILISKKLINLTDNYTIMSLAPRQYFSPLGCQLIINIIMNILKYAYTYGLLIVIIMYLGGIYMNAD